MSLQIDHSAAGDFENHDVAKPAKRERGEHSQTYRVWSGGRPIPRADLTLGCIPGARARVPSRGFVFGGFWIDFAPVTDRNPKVCRFADIR